MCASLTSHSHPNSPLGWWVVQGRSDSCAGSGRSCGTRPTAAAGGWVCCIPATRSRTDTEPRVRSTAAARHRRSETQTHRRSALFVLLRQTGRLETAPSLFGVKGNRVKGNRVSAYITTESNTVFKKFGLETQPDPQ